MTMTISSREISSSAGSVKTGAVPLSASLNTFTDSSDWFTDIMFSQEPKRSQHLRSARRVCCCRRLSTLLGNACSKQARAVQLKDVRTLGDRSFHVRCYHDGKRGGSDIVLQPRM